MEPVAPVQCNGDACGETITGVFQEECIVLTVCKRFWKLAHTDWTGKLKKPMPDDSSAEFQLPNYDHPVLVRICKYLREKQPEDIEDLQTLAAICSLLFFCC